MTACTGSFYAPQERNAVDVSPIKARLLDDEFFSYTPTSYATAEQLLSLPLNLQAELDASLQPIDDPERRYQLLRDWAFDKFGAYEYDPFRTIGLDELDAAKVINCFSFSNLFVASARYVGIDAQFQLVFSPPIWDIERRNWIYNQHINVTGSVERNPLSQANLEKDAKPVSTGTFLKPRLASKPSFSYVVDLNEDIYYDSYFTQILTDDQAASLFYSNKAIEAFIGGDLPAAYGYTKTALDLDELSVTAWTNLGAFYSKKGNIERAKTAYLTALEINPNAQAAANNLAITYRKLGDVDSAVRLESKTEQYRQRNPYYYFLQAEKALSNDQPRDSILFLKSAIRRKADEPQFYFMMADAYFRLRSMVTARSNLVTALELSNGNIPERYQAMATTLLGRSIGVK